MIGIMTFKIDFKLDLPRHYVNMKDEKAKNANLFHEIFSGDLSIKVGREELFIEPAQNVNLLTFFKDIVRVLEEEKDEDEVVYSSDEKPLKLKFENKTVCFSGKAINKRIGCINETVFVKGVIIGVKDFVDKVINWNPVFKQNPSFAKLVDFVVTIEKKTKIASLK